MKPIRTLKPDYSGTLDHQDEIHHECPHCGSFVWLIKASFDDYELASYFIDMECASCGTFAKAPTPLDRPAFI